MKDTATAATKQKPTPTSKNLKIDRATAGRGRPRGGRSGDRANYQPLTIYIDRNLHGQVGARLHLERKQFSDVIEGLLRRWMQKSDRA
jgi:hypothetical protein